MNTHAITGIDIKTGKRVLVSMPSDQRSCRWSLDFYKKEFKGLYKHFMVKKIKKQL